MKAQVGEQSGSALLIGTKTQTHVMYGTSNVNFALAPLHDRVGVIHGSMERLDRTYFFNELGLYDTRVGLPVREFQPVGLE